MERGIVINARVLFNLIESNFLISTKQHNLSLYYQVSPYIYLAEELSPLAYPVPYRWFSAQC